MAPLLFLALLGVLGATASPAMNPMTKEEDYDDESPLDAIPNHRRKLCTLQGLERVCCGAWEDGKAHGASEGFGSGIFIGGVIAVIVALSLGIPMCCMCSSSSGCCGVGKLTRPPQQMTAGPGMPTAVPQQMTVAPQQVQQVAPTQPVACVGVMAQAGA